MYERVSESSDWLCLILLFGFDERFGVNELLFATSLSKPVPESSDWFGLILLFGFDGFIGTNKI